jgi:glycosyltransferase involved in cell wall biosynthesis
MKILNVAYPFAPVSRDSVGGAEQVLNHIVEALVCAGHDSTVIARSDSQIPGHLIPVPIPDGPLNDHATRKLIHAYIRDGIAKFADEHEPDLIHFQGIDFHDYLPADLAPPALVTLHLPPEWYPASSLHPREGLHFNCVSETQAKFFGHEITVIPNGVPIAAFHTRPKKRDYIMCLGRICPEKGFHLALEAAAKLNTRLILAGEVFPYAAHQYYFDKEISPLLSERRRFIGPIGRARKNRLLAAARCTVIPSLVNETSSLVAMESLACGTPVVAFKRGALTSIIDHNRTGILVDTVSELPDAIIAAREIDPDHCRRVALQRFSSEAMIRRYLGLYETLAADFTKQTAHALGEAIAAHTIS